MTKPSPYEAEYEALLAPVTTLTGISARRASLLAKLGVETILDLLMLYPRRYEDWTNLKPLDQLVDGQEEVFRATISRVPALRRQGKRSTLRTVLRDETAAVSAIWFNQPYLQERLAKGKEAVFRGKIKRSGQTFEVTNPVIEEIDGEEGAEAISYLHPVYPLTSGLTQGVLRSLVKTALTTYAERLPEALPTKIRREHKLADVVYAYRMIHEPQDQMAYEIARRRLAFEELFMTQVGLRLIRRHHERDEVARVIELTDETTRVIDEAKHRLPFSLTGAQERVIGDLLSDMSKERPMSRLVQGDVGSGKTVVAAMAMLHVAKSGYQAVMMAPTSILAGQHYRSLQKLLADSDLKIALLTGQTPAAERRTLLSETSDGSIDILVGTHAVLEDRVSFRDLALAVTDEQHRFGVRQRIRLTKDDHRVPHVLVMSATPIPRTLGLILYGDLDISNIDEMPAGRKDILTYTATTQDYARVLGIMDKHLARGEQVYVICPLVRDSEEAGDLRSAEEVYTELAKGPLARYGIGLLHGQMKEKEKQASMQAFMERRAGVLVATTVVEVGVDNPNATVMLILNAERFGLAELHQLRGRIGRGDKQSICILSSDVGEGLARERLRALCRMQSGFDIAEKDLELRGPGDFFGTRQHGIPLFRIANLYEEQDLLEETSKAANRLLAEDPKLTATDHRRIRPALLQAFGLPMAQLGI